MLTIWKIDFFFLAMMERQETLNFFLNFFLSHYHQHHHYAEDEVHIKT